MAKERQFRQYFVGLKKFLSQYWQMRLRYCVSQVTFRNTSGALDAVSSSNGTPGARRTCHQENDVPETMYRK
jgi:hypothetical protein